MSDAGESWATHDVRAVDVDADALIDGWQDAWSGHDPAGFGAVCADGIGYEDPLTERLLAGVDALADHAGRLWSAFPDARLERTGERLSGGGGGGPLFIAAPCKLLGTHRAPLESVPATNRFVVVHCLFYCEVQGGRLLRVRGFFDVYDAAVQLGILPGRGTLGERALFMLRGFGLRTTRGG